MKLVTEELRTLVKESVDFIFRSLYHNTQNGICSVEYVVVKQVMVDLLHKDVIWKTPDAQISRFFDTGAAVHRFSKKLLT